MNKELIRHSLWGLDGYSWTYLYDFDSQDLKLFAKGQVGKIITTDLTFWDGLEDEDDPVRYCLILKDDFKLPDLDGILYNHRLFKNIKTNDLFALTVYDE